MMSKIKLLFLFSKPESGNLDNVAFAREDEGMQRERVQARKSKYVQLM